MREMRWSALRSIDGRERDQFDTEGATYFLAVEQGRLAGGIRLHCSLAPTLMSEVFPHLATRGFERAADVYEGTRLYVVPERRTEHPNKVSGYLHWSVWAHTLARGGRAIQLVTWATYVPLLMRSGLRPRPLGLPTEHEGMQLMAVSTAVSEEVLMDLLVYYDIEPVPLVTTGLAPSGSERTAA
ncbi:MAG: hypothetical protein JO048_16030 [Methylobacteriaceae bacterium]|nr:hypothetical protein [Methylobacteriaceae bacterium]